MTTPAAANLDHGAVVRYFYERTGIATSQFRRQSIFNGIARSMSRAGFSDEAEFVAHLQADEKAFDDLVAELTVGETYFYRVPEQFAFIRRRVLPEARSQRGPERPVRAWSCGCSSGEEPYSLAMLFAEEGISDRAHLLATDISREALRKAAAARYTNWSFRGTEPTLRARFFHEENNQYVLNDEIRRRVAFRYLNLAADAYPSFHTDTWGMDLIFCRNVLIYLSPPVIEMVCRRLFACLVDGGWLITAPTDPPLDRFVSCEVVGDAGGLFYRRRGAALAGRSIVIVPVNQGVNRPEAQPKSSETPADRVDPREVKRARPHSLAARLAQKPESTDAQSLADKAEALFRSGQYERALKIISAAESTAESCALRLRILANINPELAAESCPTILAKYPLSVDLTFLQAVLLMHAGRLDASITALRRALYLDPAFALGHYMLGTLLQQAGDQDDARRAYRNARNLCLASPPETELPLADGETAGRMAAVADVQMTLLAA